MSENLLSPLHIQKLGHLIEEIRLRALACIISKYNLNLVDESNFENTKLLLEKLLNWFNFENFTEEGKVLQLLLQILKYKNADLILKALNKKALLRQIKEIEKKVGCEYESVIKDIVKCITAVKDDVEEDYFMLNNFSYSHRPERVNGHESIDFYDFKKDLHIDCSKESNYNEILNQKDNVELKIQKPSQEKCFWKIEYFPWQHLIPEDKHVLSSVYDGLRYIDNKNLILQSCQFFNEVLLRDFPIEVFIQRPSVIKTFLQLIECTEQDIRIPVFKCLIKIVHLLYENIKAVLNTSLFNQKKEYYTTFVFSNIQTESENLNENYDLKMATFDEDFQFDNDCNDPNLKKYQLSVPKFCFDTLLQILPHLSKKYSQEETNCLLTLSYAVLDCLLFNLNLGIWNEKDLKNKFYKIFEHLYEVLKFQKGRNRIVYIIALYFVIKLLNHLKPPSEVELSDILVKEIHSELRSCISDFVLVLLFPQLHSEIFNYVEKIIGPDEKVAVEDYKEVLVIVESMKSCMKFLKYYGKLKTRMEKLECLDAALPSLDFHQNLNLIIFFVSSCLLKWRKSQLKDTELRLREKILIKLLAHCNDFVKICIYKEIHNHAVKLLGVEEAKASRFEFPGDYMDFLFRSDVLTEIICHGLNSSLTEVRKYSSEIIHNLLKSKFIMSEICWSDFISALIPCLSFLQCFADKSTALGRCIVKMFDPDVAKSTDLPPLELLKGNMRFLFSKNNLIRDEAISRLFWLLTKEDRDNKKLPKMSVLTGLNLSGICSCVEPQKFTKIRQSFYGPDRLCDVLEMLSAEKVEPSIRKSALSQINVMMDDVHLHPTFLEQKGLEKILQILENCLIEKEYRNYPDSVKPIISILKALALQNVGVRQDLSCQIEVIYNILRGLFLFSRDDSLRQNAVELICLLLYSDCILRVPSDLSINCTISFPELVVSRMCLPFLTHIHWRKSRHFEPSVKSNFFLKSQVQKTIRAHKTKNQIQTNFTVFNSKYQESLMSKENCLKLIRIYWAIHWTGSLSEFLTTQTSDLPGKAFSPGIPDDMKVSLEDIDCLKNCAFSLSVKQTLYNIQNATTHEAVSSSLHKLHSYFLLYNVDKAGQQNEQKGSDFGSETVLSHMLWESTLERFMTAHPSCAQDESLLLQVIRFVQLLLQSFKSERLIDWVGKLLIDEHQPLIKLLKNIGNENFGLVGKELRLAVIELTQQIVTLKTSLDRNKWFLYVELISKHLKLDKKSEFYNVAYVDWFLCLLVDLTGKWVWDFTGKTEYLEKLIIRVVEIIIAFHCTKDSVISFMGINIVKSSLLVLNHIMASTQSSLKGWEKIWFQSLTKVIGHERDANYCWMLSLWFTRDTIARAAAYTLFVCFSTTGLSCDLLIDQLNVQFEHVWAQTFKTLFDENECSFVREKAAVLLSNLTSQGTKASCGSFLQHLVKINFYQEIFKIISNYDCESELSGVKLHESKNCFSGHVITTPSFVASICVLLKSVMALNPTEVSEKLLEFNVIESLTTVLLEIPESTSDCQKHRDCLDVVQMYITVCRVLTRSIRSNCSVHSFMLQSQQCINYLFSMINYNLFCQESKTVRSLQFELWTEIFDLFSTLLADNSECNKKLNNQGTSFILINKCMTDNGIDHFISSLYIAMTSTDINLRTSVFKFFINLFRHELNTPKHMSISDIFDRKISNESRKLSVANGWKALKTAEDFPLNFGVRSADVLVQIFLLNSICAVHCCKTLIADCLGSLLAVCKSAQNFCIESGLPDSLVLNLKQICVKLNLENFENLKKPAGKKKIEPFLAESETLFKLICNLVVGNGKAKTAVADCALSTVVQKLWPWCTTRRSLIVVLLKMLCTFTHFCDQACRTLVMSGNLNMLVLKKSPGSFTLMSAVMSQVITEMDLISNTHDPQILILCLELITNCSRVTESRSVISKGNFLQCFTKLHPNRKKKLYADAVVKTWLNFFIAFSSHPDGQLILTKNQDLLDLFIIKSSSTKSSHRIQALSILRNICFHQLNRVRMLSSCSFLSLMFEKLDSEVGEELQIVAVSIWALTCNSQKAKVIIRNSGFESKLMNAKKRCILTEDTETAEIIETVLRILKNR